MGLDVDEAGGNDTDLLHSKVSEVDGTINGKPAGLYKNARTFSYLRLFGTRHRVPAHLWRCVAGAGRGGAANVYADYVGRLALKYRSSRRCSVRIMLEVYVRSEKEYGPGE
jgi:hypothetical protein